MIDLRDLRDNPQMYKDGARAKRIDVDIDRLLELDELVRAIQTELEQSRAEANRLNKEIGPQIGQLMGMHSDADPLEAAKLSMEIEELRSKPIILKQQMQNLEASLDPLEAERDGLLLKVPLPPDPDVPKGESEKDNVEIRVWNPDGFDPSQSFESQRGFKPKSHIDLMLHHGMVNFERAVKIAGARHYVLQGDGMRLQQAVLRCAIDLITEQHGFTPMTVPVIVREECMTGTGFFPAGREEAYCIEETSRGTGGNGGAGHDLFLTGTGEVGLMGLHMNEILEADQLPLQYATVSTCFRREAGAAGKDTAGLYRIHQFDKVEQVVICRADEQESRAWHSKMIGIVEDFLKMLELPHRLLQCCTGDLGPKNADMIDLECWMPSRGEEDDSGAPTGAYGETHSASRLYDFQCRRLKLRYRDENGKVHFCHSLNNTVAATPRILIPIVEMYQNEDGSITVPDALRGYLHGRERIGSGSS